MINDTWPSIKEIYDFKDEDYFYGTGNYQPILDSFGFEILIQVDDNDYQGDTRILYKDGDKYGILIFGWGSCSGCDALQACSNITEIDGLRDSLFSGIQWFDTREKLAEYVNNKDWSLEYSWYASETKEFIQKIKDLIEENKNDGEPKQFTPEELIEIWRE